MIEQIRTLIRFYEQKWHVPITLMNQDMDLHCGMKLGLQSALMRILIQHSPRTLQVIRL
jgi:hypothetical protein